MIPTFSFRTWLNIIFFSISILSLSYGKYKSDELEYFKINQQKLTFEKEKNYQAESDKIRKDKDEQINSLHDDLSRALVKLRTRPSRNQPIAAAVGQSGTGRSLFAEDAEFLEREAARADEIRIGLEACYKQYDELSK